MRRALVIALSLIAAGILNAQTDEQLLQDAIQAIRNFLGDQSITPLFTSEDKRVELFEGPFREFDFDWVPGYYGIKVRVSPPPIVVVGWMKTNDAWLPHVNTNLPEKSDDELLTLARNYASQNFPGWQDFPNWQGKIMARIKDSGYGKTVRSRSIAFAPYFVNSDGEKIMFEPAGCNVGIEPHEGNIISFRWWYNLKMTLPSDRLNTTLSPLEAEAIAEIAVRNWVAQQLAEEGYSIPNNIVFEATLADPKDPDQGWWGDSRLVVGATETSGLRLAYRIDKIEAKDANTGKVLEKWIYAYIDAHTGELLITPRKLCLLDHSLEMTGQRLPAFEMRSFYRWVPALGVILVSVFLIILLVHRAKRR